ASNNRNSRTTNDADNLMNRRYIGVICSFKALRAPAHFRSRVMRLIRWKPRSKRRSNGIPVVNQTDVPYNHSLIHRFYSKPRRWQARTQMAPNLLLDPVSRYEKHRLELPSAK